jgi:hypothetical protein
MAKKSSAARRNAPHKAPAKNKSVNLVLEPAQPHEPAAPPAGVATGTDTVAPPAVATLTSPATSKAPPVRPSPQVKETPKANPPAAKSTTSPAGTARPPARPRANLISAENYRYVLNDLRLILMLAILLFGVIIVLHFMLPQ